MNLDGEQFRILWNFWLKYSNDKLYHKGISSRTKISQIMSESLNPPKSVDTFRNFLLDEGILKFNDSGLIVLDEDKFLKLVQSNKTYNIIKTFIKDEDSTFFVE